MKLVSKNTLLAKISATLTNPAAISTALGDSATLPPDLERWLGRLKLLYGVPYNYLVPDERMLPPESMRFFYVDLNWIDALLDGAYSIGRNLSAGASGSPTMSRHQDAATQPLVRDQIVSHGAAIRAAALGTAPPPIGPAEIVSGFLLRSEVVQHYPGLGINAFLKGQTPDDTPNPTLMPILRFERLGPTSDTLLCLLLGDAYRIDMHEAPEQLHYGIDDYVTDSNGAVTKAEKAVRIFVKTGDQVTFPDPGDPNNNPTVDITACFRKQSPRTLKTMDLVGAMQNKLGLTAFDSAEFGFEMTEGVGNVKFVRNDPGDQQHS